MDVSVTVHATGTAFGVQNENAVIELVSHDVLIRCLPKDLPEFIVVDVTEMHVDDTLHVRDLKPIEGVEFLDDPDQSIVSCVRAGVEEAAAPVAEAEGAVAGEAAPEAVGAGTEKS